MTECGIAHAPSPGAAPAAQAAATDAPAASPIFAELLVVLLEGIATHIQKFWEPRMRRELLAAMEGSGAASELLPIVREAIELRRASLA